MSVSSKRRQLALRRLLMADSLSSQDELREKLEALDFEVTQSTISRDLRKVGAVRIIDSEGQSVYRLPEDSEGPLVTRTELAEHIVEIRHNGTMIVVQTIPGSASMVARHIDQTRPGGVIGTIAGEDTVFVAPPAGPTIAQTIRALETSWTGV